MKKKIISFISIFLIILGIEKIVFADVIVTPPSVELAIVGIVFLPIPAGLLLFFDFFYWFTADLAKKERTYKVTSLVNIIMGLLTGLSSALVYYEMNFTACFLVGLASVLFGVAAIICYVKKNYKLAMVLSTIGLMLGLGDIIRFGML